MKLTEGKLRQIIKEEKEYMKYVSNPRLSPHEQGHNAYVLYGSPNSRMIDHDEHNPHGTKWPESEKRDEFRNGWKGAMETDATGIIKP